MKFKVGDTVKYVKSRDKYETEIKYLMNKIGIVRIVDSYGNNDTDYYTVEFYDAHLAKNNQEWDCYGCELKLASLNSKLNHINYKFLNDK